MIPKPDDNISFVRLKVRARERERKREKEGEGERGRAFTTPRDNNSITEEADLFHSHSWPKPLFIPDNI
jgi:hypothetical protein